MGRLRLGKASGWAWGSGPQSLHPRCGHVNFLLWQSLVLSGKFICPQVQNPLNSQRGEGCGKMVCRPVGDRVSGVITYSPHATQVSIPPTPPPPPPPALVWGGPLTVGWHSGCPTCTDLPPGPRAERFYWKRRKGAWPLLLDPSGGHSPLLPTVSKRLGPCHWLLLGGTDRRGQPCDRLIQRDCAQPP